MDVQFHISCDEQLITPICDFTYSWCLNSGLNQQEATRFTIAVSELISDIILFAYPDSSQTDVNITFHNTLENVEVIVSETGEPFDPDRHRYNSREAREQHNFEGAGLRLIRRFCDEFLFINKGKEGKEFRLSKEIAVRHIDELIEHSRAQQPREPATYRSPAKATQFLISQITASDAEDIAKLIYRTYEYSYSKEDLYFPKKIEEAVLGKEKLGVIARNQSGKAVGYFAVIKKKDSNIAEVGEAVVSPAYRRQGVMNKMMEQLIAISREQLLAALFGKAVTLHPVSQKVNHKFGFKTTALMLGETLNVVYKGFDEEYPQPVSVVIDFLPLQPPAPVTIYPPGKYVDIILKTYGQLDIPVNAEHPPTPKMAQKSDIQLEIDYADATALLIIRKYGPEFEEVLTEMLDSLGEQEQLNAIYIDLPLQNSATPKECNIISDLGFIYCGLAPLFHQNKDFLRLQKINVALDLDLIDVHSNFAKQIKSFIASEYSQYA